MDNTATKTATGTALNTTETKQVRRHLASYLNCDAYEIIERLLSGAAVISNTEYEIVRNHISSHEVTSTHSCYLIGLMLANAGAK